jgi:membrane protein involved in colicin uptake
MTDTNVEMTNAWLVNNARTANNLARNEAVRRSRAEAAEERAKAKAKKAAEAAKNANNQARRAAVERSAAEAAAARAARAASRGETSNRRNKTNAANKAAKKAAENAKKAAANAEKAAANAKKAQTNALIQNIKRQWINVLSSTMNRNEKKKKGTTIYRKASVKLHPNKGGTNENFRVLSNLFEEFKTYVNRN